MRSISAFGVPALANKAYQLLESTPGTPISANVLTSGKTVLRFAAAIPTAFNLPALIFEIRPGISPKKPST